MLAVFDLRFGAPDNRWVQCNGQTINDPNSPYNGKVIPNINGEKAIMGGTSVTTEYNTFVGNNTHTNTLAEMPTHNHNVRDSGHQHGLNTAGGTGTAFSVVQGLNGSSTAVGVANIQQDNRGSSTPWDIRQRTYLGVVYMKIK